MKIRLLKRNIKRKESYHNFSEGVVLEEYDEGTEQDDIVDRL